MHRAFLLFCTSASVLSYEVVLMRLLSQKWWYHFAYMVISLALLGFGASGSILFLTFDRIKKDLEPWLVGLAGATAISYPLAFTLSQGIGLDPLQLLWHWGSWFRMLLACLCLTLPFLLAGGIVGILLTASGKMVHRMYGADLLGAGTGALAIVPALYLGPPWLLLPLLSVLVLLGALACCPVLRRPLLGVAGILLSAGLTGGIYIILPPIPYPHHTKDLAMALSLPDAKVEAVKVGPLGMIHVVGSAHIHHAPGLSVLFGLDGPEEPKDLPEQKALFLDGDSLSPLVRFTGDFKDLGYLDFTTMALPFHLGHPEKMLVIGAGGGPDVLLGLYHQVPAITALEANHQVGELVLGPFAQFTDNLYSRPGVSHVAQEARHFLHQREDLFDLIQISLVDSYGPSASGLHAATESFLYTTEAFKLYLSRLTDKGVLAVTRWLKLPPRDSLRVISTALSALKQIYPQGQPEKHLLFIRSWKTSTILIAKTPFQERDITSAIRFCDERNFDLAYFAGMKEEMADRYDLDESHGYFRGAKAIVEGDGDTFLKGYLFDLSPPTDDRPYFSHFFRWDRAKEIFHYLRKESLPLVEMGYLFMLAALAQAFLAGCLLILVPLLFLRRSGGLQRASPSPVRFTHLLAILSYFGSIGLAFMFLEMVLLSKFTLLLSHPIYAAAGVLSAIFFFAGCGSLFAGSLQGRRLQSPWIPVAAICLWVLLYAFLGDRVLYSAMGWPFGGRICLAILLLALLSFFLGMPFPYGLRLITGGSPGIIPWAWGINGCASVVGAVLGKCLTLSFGFRPVMVFACALYLLGVGMLSFYPSQTRYGNIRTGMRSLTLDLHDDK